VINHISIQKAGLKDLETLQSLSSTTFVQSHGKSASRETIAAYITQAYSSEKYLNDLKETGNIFHILRYEEEAVAYSKFQLDQPFSKDETGSYTKLDRLYLLDAYHSRKLGLHFMNFIIGQARSHQQRGIWLYVWQGNTRAINFYLKRGFKITGHHDFKLTENHSNPNYLMLLEFD